MADRRDKRDKDLTRELHDHLELETEKQRSAGLPFPDAQYAAQRDFGNSTAIQQITREIWGGQFLEKLAQDLRFGFRMLRRTPGFSILAILCLMLGIGANAAVFSWIEGILFRPYPLVSHQERMYALTETSRGNTGIEGLSWPDYLDFQKNSTLSEAFITGKIMGTTLSIGDRAESSIGQIVSANYFDALGVHPLLGRGFLPEDDFGRNAHPETVISYRTWKDRFSGDPDIVGKTQRLNGIQHTIVGVAPEGFFGTFVGYAMQFWIPASMEEVFETGGYKLEDRSARWVESFVKLKPGVTVAQAQSEMSGIAQRLENDYPTTNRGRGVRLWPLWETPFNRARSMLPTLGVMLAVVVFVLLIACANVGNLLLVRSFKRRHEMTVRLAVGAGRTRLLRQLLTEGLILTSIAAIGGLLIANWCRHLLVLFFPSFGGIQINFPGEIDLRVLGASTAVCLVSTVLFGLVPAMQTSKVDLASALKTEMGGVIGGHGKSWMRSTLVLVQVSLSFVLLVGAGLLLRSLHGIESSSPGFSTQVVLTTGVDLFGAGYDTPRAKSYQDELARRVQALPGVESVVFANITPLYIGRGFSSAPINLDGSPFPPGEEPIINYNEVGPNYLATMGIPLVSGREFSISDNENAALIAVVNETMAAQYWHGRNPVGERVAVKGRWMQIVGIAKDSKYDSMTEPARPFFYVPLRQNFSSRTSLNIRTALAPETIMPMLAREMHSLDTNLAPRSIITMAEQVRRSTWSQRMSVTLLEILGGLALLLSVIGLYGVMSYTVSQSMREMGLRMALGASPTDLLWHVMTHGLTLTALGIGIGVVAALTLTRLIGDLLYKVNPRDPLAFGSAFLVLIIAASAACFLPALRASRTDPMRAFREE
jgi:predicted permease